MNSKAKIIICSGGLILSIIGVIAVPALYVFHAMAVTGNVNIFQIFFMWVICFIFLLIGAPLMGYEGSGTSFNITINILLYVFIFFTILFLISFILALFKGSKKPALQITEQIS